MPGERACCPRGQADRPDSVREDSGPGREPWRGRPGVPAVAGREGVRAGARAAVVAGHHGKLRELWAASKIPYRRLPHSGTHCGSGDPRAEDCCSGDCRSRDCRSEGCRSKGCRSEGCWSRDRGAWGCRSENSGSRDCRSQGRRSQDSGSQDRRSQEH
ncbi:hypothetical protein SLNWT_5051 [Streptomyces albus]|uniref:Uncharacterized protein n=1 Tax=Streptomyces albus (strain ATCC 21838 / DSM 41398 / FERM P-419 / JCM 4703 / NBRC 107858) TaxID=1081613 RepID=A0A0B5F4Y6_STRA4|nr:hypothetical protein SLNWT_5051 [Streptomyces albus]